MRASAESAGNSVSDERQNLIVLEEIESAADGKSPGSKLWNYSVSDEREKHVVLEERNSGGGREVGENVLG